MKVKIYCIGGADTTNEFRDLNAELVYWKYPLTHGAVKRYLLVVDGEIVNEYTGHLSEVKTKMEKELKRIDK